MTNVSFIGAGNMAYSIIRGLLDSPTKRFVITTSDPDETKREDLVARGVSWARTNQEAINQSEAVILAVKPQLAAPVLQELEIDPSQLLISIAAGVNVSSLAAWTNPNQCIVRCMPNTPALLRKGITGLFSKENVSEFQKGLATELMSSIGETSWVTQESEIDSITALSGSGPAYFFFLMEQMVEAGLELGLSKELSENLAKATAVGAAEMALVSSAPLTELRQNVTSPGGTTEAAINYMEKKEVSISIKRAIFEAKQKAVDLSREFGNQP